MKRRILLKAAIIGFVYGLVARAQRAYSSIVFSDSFTVGADIGIAAYDVNSYVYVLGATTDMTVNAANDRVQDPTVLANDKIARVKNAAVPTDGTGVISVTGFSPSTSDNPCGICCRCKTDNTANLYLCVIDGNGGTVVMWRMDAGAFVLLSNPAAGGIGGTSRTLTFKGVTNGSQVDLTLTVTGFSNFTFSDTAANRKLDGTFGIYLISSATGANVPWIDDLSISTGGPPQRSLLGVGL